MKPIKMFGLVAATALMAMASMGGASAMAESTALCSVDENPCTNHIITHVHYLSLGHVKLLNPIATVECNSLFLGDALNNGLASPLVIHGNFTYTSCLRECTLSEENGPAELKFLKLGHELADVEVEVLLHAVCPSFINCRYVGSGQIAHALGPLLASMLRGDLILEEPVYEKESGILCPSTNKLDFLFEPDIHTYISK